MKLIKVVFLGIFLVFLCATLSAEAATIMSQSNIGRNMAKVTAVTVRVSNRVELDNNTLRYNFTGVITTNGPTTVKYKWIRSDGAIAPVNNLVFESAGAKEVTDYWQLGKTGQERNLWEAIEIQSPNQVTSNQAKITVPALPQPKVTNAVASISGPVDLGNNSVRFDFSGAITVNGPTTVRYRWTRSDLTADPEKELVFESAGTKNTATYWQLGKADHEVYVWEAIEILSPNPMTSNQAHTLVPAMPVVTNVVVSTASTVATASVPNPVDMGNNVLRYTFAGDITVNGPTTVKYRWTRSDGGAAPVIDLIFEGAGTKRVTTYWEVGKTQIEKNLWEAIEIQSPNKLTSNQANIIVPAL